MLDKDIKKIIVNETPASFWLIKKVDYSSLIFVNETPPILHWSCVQPKGWQREILI